MRIRAKVTNAAKVGRAFSDAAREVAAGKDELLREVGQEGQQLLRNASPSSPGHPLWEGIKFRRGGDVINFTVHARDPESGYDYAAVTRFGHRVSIIEPVNAKALIIGGAGVEFDPKAKGNDRPFRAWVSGSDPGFDWLEFGWEDVVAEAEDKLVNLGQRIELRAFT